MLVPVPMLAQKESSSHIIGTVIPIAIGKDAADKGFDVAGASDPGGDLWDGSGVEPQNPPLEGEGGAPEVRSAREEEHVNSFACFALILLESSTMPFGYNSADKYWCKLSAEPASTAFIDRRGCVSHHSFGFENEPSALISPEDRFCAQTSLIFSKVSSSITPSVIEYA